IYQAMHRLRCVETGPDRGFVVNVSHHGVSLNTLLLQPEYQLVQRIGTTPCHDNFGACKPQGLGEMAAQATRSTCDQRHLPCHVELIAHNGLLEKSIERSLYKVNEL